jgi:hypothetical protein
MSNIELVNSRISPVRLFKEVLLYEDDLFGNNMKYYQLDKEEQQILNALDKDELVSVATKEDITRYSSYASATLNLFRIVYK